jgi:hypothetical protein
MHFASIALKKCWMFHDVVFTDECTIMLERYARKSYRRSTEAVISVVRPKAKHPVKVHVWAGISWNIATSISIFDGKLRMRAALFCRILKEHYKPFQLQFFRIYGRCPVLQMDNDPKHTSKRAWRWLLDNNVKTMVWPAESPDLNPIEPVWHELKNYLRQMKPENKDDLVAKIKQFWSERMTMSQCRRYVAHIRNVLPLVVQNKGGPT